MTLINTVFITLINTVFITLINTVFITLINIVTSDGNKLMILTPQCGKMYLRIV